MKGLEKQIDLMENSFTILHTESSTAWGGQEIRIFSESLGMIERGHRVIIAAQESSILRKKASDVGLETITLSFEKKDYPKTFFKILNLIKQLKPDFINTHSSRDSWTASMASRASSLKPIIIRTRHLSTPVAKNLTSSIIYRLLPHKIVTTGKAIKKQLIERNHVLPEKIISIPTGVDLNIFDPNQNYKDIRQELSFPKETPLIGMVSVLRSWKGHDYFINSVESVLKRFPHARFIIAGDGPRNEDIKNNIKEKNLTDIIFMLGHREDIPDIMSSLDILVHPSYASEGVPQSVAQGMAMKLPVIATELEALMEIVEDKKTGLLTPVKNSNKLAEKIMLLLEDQDLRATLGNNSRQLVLEKFSLEKMLDSTENLYNILVSNK